MLGCYTRRKARTSSLWQIFKRVNPGVAKCSLCGKVLSFKTSNSNLKRHLLAKHYDDFDMIVGRTIIPKKKIVPVVPVPRLIELVKKHRILWDPNADGYQDNKEQHAKWKQIASELYPMGDEKGTAATISDQFTDLKNMFFANPRCEFAKELSFLEPLRPEVEEEDEEIEMFREISNTNDDEEDSDENQDADMSTKDKEEEQRPQPTRRPKAEKRVSLTTAASKPECNARFDNPDGDTLFLLSLAEEIRKVPQESALAFKADLLTKFRKQLKRYEERAK